MQTLNLVNIPSQSFSTRLQLKRFTLRLKDADGVMISDIECDGTPLIKGERILPNQPIIAYKRLEYGNFILLTEDEALPDWREFGKTQYLIYLSPDEIAAL